MGVPIHYRGKMDDLSQVETLEDRLLDLVFSLGGRATIWRSYADHDPARVMRGLMIEMAPGQETLSLLISPEGHLTPLFQIEDAEKAPFDGPPHCFIKTQFGSLQRHIAIVHLLDAIIFVRATKPNVVVRSTNSHDEIPVSDLTAITYCAALQLSESRLWSFEGRLAVVENADAFCFMNR